MRIISIVVIIIACLSSARAQSVKYGNNETSTYSDSQRSSDFTYLMWDRNDEGDGNFSNGNTPKFFYWDNDDSKLHFLLDTGNMRRLNAKFNTVGIGTSSPNAPLHVYEPSGSSSTMILDADVDQNPNVKFALNGQNMANIRVNERGGDQLQFEVGEGLLEAMSITQDGNVGIGTVNPSNLLTVNGTAKTEEVIVDENVGADFVFEDGYDLPKLKEVESHIKKHKHLPEIPTAQEMKQNGVKVGDLQMKLLQKVEELTLYVIELKKENKELKKRLKELETANN